MSTENDRLVSVAEAAQALGTTPLSLLLRLKRGGLEGREIEGTWYLTRGSLDAFCALDASERFAAVCVSGCAKSKTCSGCG